MQTRAAAAPNAADGAAHSKSLPAALRALASTAAEQAGGGVALIFVRSASRPALLRAAAGFATPETARAAAEALAADVEQAIASRRVLSPPCPAAMGPVAEGGVRVYPLRYGDVDHGALVVGTRHELDARGMLCPLPVIRVQDRIATLTRGDVLHVVCTDPGALNDIPTWCRLNGHRVLETRDAGREVSVTIEVEEA